MRMLSPEILTDFRLTCLERDLGVHGVHVYQQGSDPVEHHMWADDRSELWSASKTFTSVAVGIGQEEGLFTLADLVLDHFPEYSGIASPGSESIRVIDLLQMRCGKDYDMFQATDRTIIGMVDWAELFFRGDQVVGPGEHFFYANACTYMLGRLIEKTSGCTLRDYLVRRLFTPLDIINPWWNSDPMGHTLGCVGLQLTLGEFSRLGRLLLQRGSWCETALLAPEYVDSMHADVVPTAERFGDDEWQAGYGYQVWRNVWPGSFRADGMYGQFGIVLPDRDAVVTVTSHNEHKTADILAAVFTDIVSKL